MLFLFIPPMLIKKEKRMLKQESKHNIIPWSDSNISPHMEHIRAKPNVD